MHICDARALRDIATAAERLQRGGTTDVISTQLDGDGLPLHGRMSVINRVLAGYGQVDLLGTRPHRPSALHLQSVRFHEPGAAAVSVHVRNCNV